MSSFPAFNHYALTVSNLQRSIEWYERLFESPPVGVIEGDNFRAALWSEPMFAIHENQQQRKGDVFDEFRIGLDHIAFGCASREELESWPARLNALGIEHGEILDRSYGAGLAFRDPDNI
jgi:catechol 2,3-dioxygenase-like lactoylglutathione lyase family enzyme